jgi:hypothetical protein
MVAELRHPLERAILEARVRRLWEQSPIIGAVLHRERWMRGTPPAVNPSACVAEADDFGVLGERFALDREPPLRLRLTEGNTALVLEGHHAAFDGLGLATVVAELTSPTGGRVDDAPVRSIDGVKGDRSKGDRSNGDRATGDGASAGPSLASRLLHPADRVAPSSPRPAQESFVAHDIQVGSGTDFTVAWARECVGAAFAHNSERGVPFRRAGLSLGLGGSRVVGNTATYRRVDVDPRRGGDIGPAVRAALRDQREPAEFRFAPSTLGALARPVAHRFSDSMLLSNLALVDAPGVRRLLFFPVARGRSAVAFGAASVARGHATLTVRARDLDTRDARMLVARVANRLGFQGSDRPSDHLSGQLVSAGAEGERLHASATSS